MWASNDKKNDELLKHSSISKQNLNDYSCANKKWLAHVKRPMKVRVFAEPKKKSQQQNDHFNHKEFR